MDKSVALRRVEFTEIKNARTSNETKARVYESAPGIVSLQLRAHVPLRIAGRRNGLVERDLYAHADLDVYELNELIAALVDARDAKVSGGL